MKTLITLAACLLLAVMSIPGCSGRKAPEIYAEGIAAEKAGNTALALERFEEVVKDFSAEAVAETAMYKIVMLRGNSPMDRRGAVAADMRYIELYPNSERVPTVMFMMAFLYNNELQEIDSARKYYDLFLAKYPGHELAPSARFELETLGKTPDDLLKTAGEETVATSPPKTGQGRP
jgi:outer membrane protein assembly factor BamD (BamD/ComL family)